MADLRALLRDIQAQHAAVPAEEWEAQRRRFIQIGEAAMSAGERAARAPGYDIREEQPSSSWETGQTGTYNL